MTIITNSNSCQFWGLFVFSTTLKYVIKWLNAHQDVLNKKCKISKNIENVWDSSILHRVSDAKRSQDTITFTQHITTPFCTPNRHFFIWFRHIAIDFVTLALGLNRGSHYELVHTCLTKHTTVCLGSCNRQRAFNFGRVFSIVKVECPLSLIWPKSNCGALCHSSVHLSKKTAPFSD